MNVVYYTQNLRDLLWVLPLWQETGGTFCSELATTQQQVREYDATLPFVHVPTKQKLTVGREVGSGKLSLKRKQVRLSLEQLARELRPDVIVSTSNHRHALDRERRAQLAKKDNYWKRLLQVQAFHGVSSKGVKFNEWMSDFDLLLLPGRRERDEFLRLQILGEAQYALIGHPKADRVVRGEITRERARASLALNDAPTILYAPTHGALSSFFTWGEAICDSVPRACNLIVKPHPSLVTTAQSEGVGDEVARISKKLRERGTLWLPQEPDVMPLMAAADVLVTDYSSVAEEWLVFNRPMIFVDHLANATGRDRAQRDKGNWHGIFHCGRVVTQSDDIAGAVDRTLNESASTRAWKAMATGKRGLQAQNLEAQWEDETRHEAEEFSRARQKLRDYVFEDLDGHCARRAANAISEAFSQR